MHGGGREEVELRLTDIWAIESTRADSAVTSTRQARRNPDTNLGHRCVWRGHFVRLGLAAGEGYLSV